MEELSVGDVVVLKSGGPEMTVTAISERDTVQCVYFPNGNDHQGALRYIEVPAAVLERPTSRRNRQQ